MRAPSSHFSIAKTMTLWFCKTVPAGKVEPYHVLYVNAQTLEAIIAGHPPTESKSSCHGDSAKRQASINRVAAKRLRCIYSTKRTNKYLCNPAR
jgi:hypothetical protein